MGIAAGRLWIRAVSQHVSFALFFFQVQQAGSEG